MDSGGQMNRRSFFGICFGGVAAALFPWRRREIEFGQLWGVSVLETRPPNHFGVIGTRWSQEDIYGAWRQFGRAHHKTETQLKLMRSHEDGGVKW
jgi:hypothetical protein